MGLENYFTPEELAEYQALESELFAPQQPDIDEQRSIAEAQEQAEMDRIDQEFEQEIAIRKEYDAPITAGALGAARGLTFGASDLALRGLDVLTPEELANYEKYNPTASIVGEVGGAIAPIIASGGSGLLAKGGQIAAKEGIKQAGRKGVLNAIKKGATKAANYAPTTVLSRNALKVGEKVGEKIGSNLLKRITTEGLEGAVYGAGQFTSKAAMDQINWDNLSGEVLDTVGVDALLSGLFPVGTTILGKGFSKIKDVGQPLIQKASKGISDSFVGRMFNSNQSLINALGADTPARSRKILKEIGIKNGNIDDPLFTKFREEFDKIYAYADPEKKIKKVRLIEPLDSIEDTYKKIESAREEIIDAYRKKMDEANSIINNEAPELQIVRSKSAVNAKSKLENLLDDKIEVLSEKIIPEAEPIIIYLKSLKKNIGTKIKEKNLINDLWTLRKDIDDSVNWTALTDPKLTKSKKDIRNKINDIIDETVENYRVNALKVLEDAKIASKTGEVLPVLKKNELTEKDFQEILKDPERSKAYSLQPETPIIRSPEVIDEDIKRITSLDDSIKDLRTKSSTIIKAEKVIDEASNREMMNSKDFLRNINFNRARDMLWGGIGASAMGPFGAVVGFVLPKIMDRVNNPAYWYSAVRAGEDNFFRSAYNAAKTKFESKYIPKASALNPIFTLAILEKMKLSIRDEREKRGIKKEIKQLEKQLIDDFNNAKIHKYDFENTNKRAREKIDEKINNFSFSKGIKNSSYAINDIDEKITTIQNIDIMQVPDALKPKVLYLKKRMPKTDVNVFTGTTRKLTISEKGNAEKDIKYAESVLNVLDDLNSGAMNKQLVDAFTTLYPDRYMEFVNATQDKFKKVKDINILNKYNSLYSNKLKTTLPQATQQQPETMMQQPKATKPIKIDTMKYTTRAQRIAAK